VGPADAVASANESA